MSYRPKHLRKNLPAVAALSAGVLALFAMNVWATAAVQPKLPAQHDSLDASDVDLSENSPRFVASLKAVPVVKKQRRPKKKPVKRVKKRRKRSKRGPGYFPKIAGGY